MVHGDPLDEYTYRQFEERAHRQASALHASGLKKGSTPGTTRMPRIPACFYAATYPDSRVAAIHKAPGDFPGGKAGDGGYRWSPIFDDQPIASIGAITVSPSNPNVIYVGSGEANIRGNVPAGNGIYEFTDRGQDLKPRVEAGGPRSAR